jgi:N-acetylmuramoyl-L-alanine amidase
MARMFQPSTCMAALLLLALAGCGAPRPFINASSKEVPRDVVLGERTPTAAPRPIQTNSLPQPTPPSIPPEINLPQEDWISLGRWARENGIGTLTQLTANGYRTFGLDTAAGKFVVHTGSILAQWRGLELRLGFEPQLIGEEPFLHHLDLEKNLLPLLSRASVPAPGPHVIVLDPGHGGSDSGARSATGRLEKDYTLDWALRLGARLESAGWKVFLTRSNDVQVSLAERVAIADAHQADLFLSLHFNGTTEPQHSGIETYCVTPTGMPSNVTRGYEDNAALAFPNNQFDAQNLQLALRLHREVLAASGANDRGVRRARFLAVLRGQSRPAVLLEGGYLSNPDEASLIAAPQYREKLAEAVAKALEKS